MIIHKNILIKGSVQGVGFRYSALHKALEFNVNGYIKNQFNGNVYIEAEGEELDVEKFIYWCKKGPRMSYIKDIEITDSNIKNYTFFYIR